MNPFLEYVATDLLKKHGSDLSRVAVVFPNKRASLFLNEHLARQAAQPIWSPAYMTISDLFRSHTDLKVADPIKLVCDLHKCFCQCTGIDETLDHFYGWGQLLLSDFDDLDKNMAPADKVFANLRDIHELDDVSYLSQQQKDIIRKFFSNFSDDHNTELKRRFLQLWSHIGDIYKAFNSCLASQGLAYEGALYRQVALDERLSFEYDTYVFVGFNLLQEVERTLFRRLCKQGKARFYWDYDVYYMNESRPNEAGHFISQYLADFPNELDSSEADIYANFSRQKSITYISAPTENIQARYVSSWLREHDRVSAGRRTAIVLANESLLQTVIHCLPDEVEKVNITTGYPLAQTPVASLIGQLINLQTAGYAVQSDRFRLRYVNAVLRHPYARYVSPQYQDVLDLINSRRIYYPSPEQLCLDEGLNLLFTPFRQELSPATLLPWLLALLRHIARQLPDTPDQQLTSESVFRMYTLLNRLNDLAGSGDLAVDIITLQRLMNQLVASTSIPFHGEPAEGLQVMGVLETRNLDFDHVLLLSCNEGNLPKGVSDTSFIPYSIRKAYGLTTVDHKVAIYAYYFHRLLQRASDVTVVYNNSTNDGQTGEMSRFMLQLMVESRHHITFRTLQAGQKPAIHRPVPIQKTPQVVAVMHERFQLLSPSALARYIRCPLNFYYHYVSDLIEPDDNEEDLVDNRVFGNIFHKAAQILYEKLCQRSSLIHASDLDRLLKEEVDIERAVDMAFKQELFQLKDLSAPMPAFDGLQLINREVIVKYVRQLLEVDRRLTPFTIIGLEKYVECTLPIAADGRQVKVGGIVDRMDVVTNADGSETIRVVDYKTGNRRQKAMPDVAAIFDQEQLRNHSDYYLQAFLYSHILRQRESQPVSPCLLYIQHAGTEDYDPTLYIGKEPVSDIATVADTFMQLFAELVREVFDPAVDFTPTADKNRCRNCPYASLCGI